MTRSHGPNRPPQALTPSAAGPVSTCSWAEHALGVPGRNTAIVSHPHSPLPAIRSARRSVTPEDPAEAWSALAPLLAGRPRVRLSRDGGRNYPLRHERDLTATLPPQPAAVLVHAPDGTCSCLCLDFDAKEATGGEPAVLADIHSVSGLLHAAGAGWIRDRSPSGGRHLYVPLAQPMPFHRARELVEALALLCPTLDPSPHRGIRHGCIRPPGAVHRSGGHQQLETDLGSALSLATHRNGADAVDRLWDELSEQRELVRASRREDQPTEAAHPEGEHQSGSQSAVLSGARAPGMSTQMLRTAVDGTWDRGRYASPSEARQAVLVSAAAAAMTLTDVQRRLLEGTWPGLAQFYARYSPAHRQAALRRDWSEAVRYVSAPSPSAKTATVRNSNTSGPTTQRGALEYRFVRTWLNAVAFTEHRYGNDRSALTKRMLLRAMGEAAMKTRSATMAFGVRALAVAAGTDAGTVSRHLKALAAETEPLIVRVAGGRGVEADTYRLVIPERLSPAAQSRSWRRGKLHALRPVFRVLGVPAALVYEQLEQSTVGPMTSRELVQGAGLSRAAVHEALAVLSSWNLAVFREGSWSMVTGADLEMMAEALGATVMVAEQLARYRAERSVWHAWLAARRAAHSAGYVLDIQSPSLLWELTEPDDWWPPVLAHAPPAAVGV